MQIVTYMTWIQDHQLILIISVFFITFIMVCMEWVRIIINIKYM